jgi:hypothetical protein
MWEVHIQYMSWHFSKHSKYCAILQAENIFLSFTDLVVEL